MRKVDLDSVQRKILSTAFTFGICGGLFISAMKSFDSQYNLLELCIYLSALVALGIVIGIVASHYSVKGTLKLLKVDDNGDLRMPEQKILFITLIIMIAAHFVNAQMSEWNQFSAVLITGGVFILSLINGIFDISSITSRRTLALGFAPVALSFIIGYYTVGSVGIINFVWIFGFMFLLSFLLLLSNMQLTSQLFTAKDINVANRRKIKRFNFGAVVIFSLLCVIVVNFRKIISFSGRTIVKFTNWIYVVVAKFTIWLLNDPQPGSATEKTNSPRPDSTFEYSDKPVLEVVLVIVILAVLLAAIFSIAIIIKKSIRKPTINNRTIDFNEFDEESEIVREARRLNLRKKFKYTLEELDEVDDSGEKIRYLYGFILERLYHYKINIAKSDTPEEIIHKILLCENGQELSDKGFDELTEKYRRVRYGKKSVDFDKELRQLGEVMEKAIEDLVSEPPK